MFGNTLQIQSHVCVCVCVCVWPLVFYFKLWENHPAGHKHRAHTSAWAETQPAGTPKNTNRDSLRPVQESHHSIIQLLQCLSICELLLNKLVTRLGTAGVTWRRPNSQYWSALHSTTVLLKSLETTDTCLWSLWGDCRCKMHKTWLYF